ncbi:2'-deoxymugineic-acid 2'-dioxygenase [Dichanthelium oligosanthes]|uniref:2'-deoxymugineic-acid 2'-dioxygenase n=1 Tax=Dichanthelium oligosanthes TaxID=888268 RepID=A0A1E5VLG2_9POAL|nr:2'-deoxymugineic-acid 2'-dioxygenase [Dichanthelium oligosanthes]
MENMLHGAPTTTTPTSLPGCFVFPPDQLVPATTAAVSLPVVDMSRSRDEVRRAILDAGKELGFFEVVNHGVPEQLMRDMEAVGAEFFGMPAADKAGFYSEDVNIPNRLYSGTIYETGGEQYWRDCLRLAYDFPAGDHVKDWPDQPQRLREIAGEYVVKARGVGMELLHLVCEAIGLRPHYFEGGISGGDVVLHVNHYPTCPDPSATLGLPPHCDRNLITVLLPGAVHGLEVAYNGDWIKVEPGPGALVVNFGQQLEVVTNGMLKSIEHRVTTSSELARTSVATFIMPAGDCLIGPAEEFVGEDNPPLYRTLTFAEFKRTYNVVKLGASINLARDLKNAQKKI